MVEPPYPDDFFGDRFCIETLPLARRACGYAVQMLDTDTLLDKDSGLFFEMRSPLLHGSFTRFDDAFSAASNWVLKHCPHPSEHRLAIVPVGFDEELGRHILIYGVLRGQP